MSQVALVATFLATLFLPVAPAVGVGVRSVAGDAAQPGGLGPQGGAAGADRNDLAGDETAEDPRRARSGRARRLRQPALRRTQDVADRATGSVARPGVGRGDPAARPYALGSTFFLVVDEYANALDATDSRLFISGVDPVLRAQHRRSHSHHERDPIEIFEASDLIGESTTAAIAAAELWVELAPGLEHPEDHQGERTHHPHGPADAAPEVTVPTDAVDLEPDNGLAEDPEDPEGPDEADHPDDLGPTQPTAGRDGRRSGRTRTQALSSLAF